MYSSLLTTLSFFVCYLLPGYVTGQSLEAFVTDPAGNGIPYVTVYIPAREQGLITDENGYFTLQTEQAPDSLTVLLSAIGHQTVRTTFQKITVLTSSREAIVLPVATYDLAAVEISDKRLRLRQKRLGMPGMLNAIYLQTVERKPIPFEAGPIIRPGKRCRLDAVELRVKDMTADTVLLDLNVYAMKAGRPGQQLLRERVFLLLTKEEVGRIISVDLTEQQLWIKGNFLVTFRLLDVKGATGHFAFKGKTGNKHGLVRRENGKWKKNYLTPALFALVSYEK